MGLMHSASDETLPLANAWLEKYEKMRRNGYELGEKLLWLINFRDETLFSKDVVRRLKRLQASHCTHKEILYGLACHVRGIAQACKGGWY